jgi:hypothetical protein
VQRVVPQEGGLLRVKVNTAAFCDPAPITRMRIAGLPPPALPSAPAAASRRNLPLLLHDAIIEDFCCYIWSMFFALLE